MLKSMFILTIIIHGILVVDPKSLQQEEFIPVSPLRWVSLGKFAVKDIQMWINTLLYVDPCNESLLRVHDGKNSNITETKAVCEEYFSEKVIIPLEKFCTHHSPEGGSVRRRARGITSDIFNTLRMSSSIAWGLIFGLNPANRFTR